MLSTRAQETSYLAPSGKSSSCEALRTKIRHEKGEGFPGQRIVVLPRSAVLKARERPLLRGLLPTDIGIFVRAQGHLRARRVGIDQAIFIYCTKGTGWCELHGQRHQVRAGEILVVPPDQPHVYGADEEEPWTIYWFHLTGDHVPFLLQELGVTADSPVFYLGDAPGLLSLFEHALEVLEQGYAPSQLLYASQALAHLVSTMILRRQQHTPGEPDSRQKVTQCISYMKEHIRASLRLPMLARLANFCPSHFNAMFRRETGYSCIDYLIRLRMHEACQLLDVTNCSVKAIAARVGYEDPLYFSRVFKAMIGSSPLDYRRAHKG